jgi:hypothetical protein
MASPFTFRTKPTGPHANFTTDCERCGGEVSISNGRVDRHACERQPVEVWADPKETSEWQEIRKGILNRLEAALDNR